MEALFGWFLAMLPVWVKTAIISALFAAMGHTAVWCESCGEICECDNPPVMTFTDHHGESHTGPLCRECKHYWFEMEDSLRDA